MKINWKLKGGNLFKFGCGKDTTIHPETCTDMVLMGHEGNQTLTEWITNDQEVTDLGSSLTDWLTRIFMQTVGDTAQFIIQASYIPSSLDWTDANSFLLGVLNSDQDVRVPFGTYQKPGVFRVSTGLEVNGSALSVASANSAYYGGIKLGFTPTVDIPNGVPVELDLQGKAYVNMSGSFIPETTIYSWNENNPTHYSPTPDINPSVYNWNDNFAFLNIYNFINAIKNVFNTTPDQTRIYPVRADALGHLYTFIPWTDHTYGVYNNTYSVGNGLVPYSSDSTINNTAYLCKNGTWKVPSYNDLQNKLTVFNTTNNGLVPAATDATSKFLKGDGTWAVPTNTLYYGDIDSIDDNNKGTIIKSSNTFTAYHQFNSISDSFNTDTLSRVYSNLSDVGIREEHLTIVGEKNNTTLEPLLASVFDFIATGGPLHVLPNIGRTLKLSFETNEPVKFLLDDSAFLAAINDNIITPMFYGDVEYDDSNNHNIIFDLINSKPTHYDITFDLYPYQEADVDKLRVTVTSKALPWVAIYGQQV